MENKLKDELNRIDIPKELHDRVVLGVKQAKKEDKESKKRSKWMIGIVASIMILLATSIFSGTYLVEATNTFIQQVLGSKMKILEIFSDDDNSFSYVERHLELAEEQLSSEEFLAYSQLVNEHIEILYQATLEDRDLHEEEQKRLEALEKDAQKYEKKIETVTTHTLEEAQKMVSYPINRPKYIPEGYLLEKEVVRTEENNIGVDPVVFMQYRHPKNKDGFHMTTEKTDVEKRTETKLSHYDHIDSYQLRGIAFDFAFYKDSNIQGMRVTIREEGYEIVMSADILSKEEMEKILLSMID